MCRLRGAFIKPISLTQVRYFHWHRAIYKFIHIWWIILSFIFGYSNSLYFFLLCFFFFLKMELLRECALTTWLPILNITKIHIKMQEWEHFLNSLIIMFGYLLWMVGFILSSSKIRFLSLDQLKNGQLLNLNWIIKILRLFMPYLMLFPLFK